MAGLTTRTVAQRANASVPAIYEVFGDKAGLIRAVFFEGFRMLADEVSAVEPTDDPLADIRRLAEGFRGFVVANPVLAQVMLSRPFADFGPARRLETVGGPALAPRPGRADERPRTRSHQPQKVRSCSAAKSIGRTPASPAPSDWTVAPERYCCQVGVCGPFGSPDQANRDQ